MVSEGVGASIFSTFGNHFYLASFLLTLQIFFALLGKGSTRAFA